MAEGQELPVEAGQQPDRLARLTEAATGLMAEVHQMTDDAGNQFVSLAERATTNSTLIRRQQRTFWVLAVSVFLDVLLSVGLAVALNGVAQNNHRNSQLTQRTSQLTDRLNTAQTTQRQKALCPMYGLFLSSENPKSRAAYPQGPAAYDKAFTILHQGYDALNCAEFITQGH